MATHVKEIAQEIAQIHVQEIALENVLTLVKVTVKATAPTHVQEIALENVLMLVKNNA